MTIVMHCITHCEVVCDDNKFPLRTVTCNSPNLCSDKTLRNVQLFLFALSSFPLSLLEEKRNANAKELKCVSRTAMFSRETLGFQ